jgi:hypothetical protein
MIVAGFILLYDYQQNVKSACQIYETSTRYDFCV